VRLKAQSDKEGQAAADRLSVVTPVLTQRTKQLSKKKRLDLSSSGTALCGAAGTSRTLPRHLSQQLPAMSVQSRCTATPGK
jgi:hypothetical protein